MLKPKASNKLKTTCPSYFFSEMNAGGAKTKDKIFDDSPINAEVVHNGIFCSLERSYKPDYKPLSGDL